MKFVSLSLMGALAALALGGCGNDIAGDGKKIADLMCKAQALQEKSASTPTDPALIEEATKLMTEGEELLKTLEAKYNETQKEELQKAFLAAVSACS